MLKIGSDLHNKPPYATVAAKSKLTAKEDC